MNVAPVAIELGGVSYAIMDRTDIEDNMPYGWKPYRELMQPTTVQSADIAGASRPAKSSRPDQLSWRLDDWSQGEGQQYIDFSDPDSFKQYWYSDGAVDVRTKGSLKLGYKWYQSSTLGGTTRYQGPFVLHRGGKEEAYVDDRAYQNTAGIDTFSDKGQMARTAGNQIFGQPRAFGGFVYASYYDGTAAVNSSDIRRITSAFATAQYVAQGGGSLGGSNHKGAMPANNRLYATKYGGGDGQVLLNNTSALTGTLPLTLTTRYAVDGVGSAFGLDSLAAAVYLVTMTETTDDEPRIHMYPMPNQSAGGERGRLPSGFRMWSPHAGAGSEQEYRSIAVLGDLVFVAGFRIGDTGQVDVPCIAYFSASRSASWTIREGIITTAERALVLYPATKNLLIIGTDGGRCFAYDIAAGGISQLFDGITAGETPISLDFDKGIYWAGVRTTVAGTAGTVKLYRTKIGAGRYPASAILYSSLWDFGYPEVNKIIDEIEVVTKPLPVSGSSSPTVTITLYADETAITTDKNGTTLVHSGSGATRTKYKISGLNSSQVSTIRSCRNLRVVVTLTSDTNDQSTTPEVTSINIKVLPREFIHFYEMVLDLNDDVPGGRTLGQTYPRTGEQKADALRVMKEADPPQSYAFVPRYRSGSQGKPSVSTPTYEVYLDDCDIVYPQRGNAIARVLLRRSN